MASPTTPPRRSRFAQQLSTILFIAAIGFAAAAIWIWYTGDDAAGPGTPPPARSAGDIELAHVLQVLDEQDDAWDYSRNPAGARTDQFDAPGQVLANGDALLVVFIFTGASPEERIASREAAETQIDLDAMTLSTSSGTVINGAGEPLWQAARSSVLTILVGGDQAQAEQVETALAALP